MSDWTENMLKEWVELLQAEHDQIKKREALLLRARELLINMYPIFPEVSAWRERIREWREEAIQVLGEES